MMLPEPILQSNPDRFVLFPIKHNRIWDAYKQAEQSFWTAEEVPLAPDLSDWEKLNTDEKHYIKWVLAFFAASDGIVNENICINFLKEVQIPEARCYYGFQYMIENVHCVTGDTLLMTEKGQLEIKPLVNTSTKVWNGNKFSEVKILETGIQRIFKVTLSDGTELKCTDGHNWYIRKGNQLHPESCKKVKIETKNLNIGDVIYPFELGIINIPTDPDYLQNPYIHGFFSGDGTYCNGFPVLKLYGEKQKLIQEFGFSDEEYQERLIDHNSPYEFYLTKKINKPKYFVPINYTIETKLKWLEGLLDADGCINHNVKKTTTAIQFTSVNKQFIQDVKILLTTLGITAQIKTVRKEGQFELPDGNGGLKLYDCNKIYCLYITSYSVGKLINLGFSPKRLQLLSDKKTIGKKKLIRVVSVEDLGYSEMTYCFNEPENHAGVFNGVLTSQSEMYSLLIDTYIQEAEEKNFLFKAIENIPVINKKAKWALRWLESKEATFGEKLIAFAVVEGIFFSGSFCSIFWLKKRGLMPGLSLANELISRDEGQHCAFAVLMYYMINNKPSKENIIAMFRDAVEIECEFVSDALPVGLIGMNSNLMCQYIRFVADYWLEQLGVEKIYGVKNPFDWMITLGLNAKTNFFEKKVSEYSLSTAGKTQEENTFSVDADF